MVAVDVRSAHNVGSLFRSCDGFGAELFLVGITPRPAYDDDFRLPHMARKIHKDIAKTALGAEDTVSWRSADTLLECRDILEHEGFTLVAIEQAELSLPMTQLTAEKDIAIVLGREVEGLNPVELSLCECIYEIPMLGDKESFNVSVTAGIALYQLRSSLF